jgi:hypothetical protein
VGREEEGEEMEGTMGWVLFGGLDAGQHMGKQAGIELARGRYTYIP